MPGLFPPVKVVIAFHVIPPLSVYWSITFDTGLMVSLVVHVMLCVLSDVNVSPPFGEFSLITSMVNVESEVSEFNTVLVALRPVYEVILMIPFLFPDNTGMFHEYGEPLLVVPSYKGRIEKI